MLVLYSPQTSHGRPRVGHHLTVTSAPLRTFCMCVCIQGWQSRFIAKQHSLSTPILQSLDANFPLPLTLSVSRVPCVLGLWACRLSHSSCRHPICFYFGKGYTGSCPLCRRGWAHVCNGLSFTCLHQPGWYSLNTVLSSNSLILFPTPAPNENTLICVLWSLGLLCPSTSSTVKSSVRKGFII